MVLTFSECIEKYGSKYKIKKLISEGKLYQLEKGIYSEKKYVPEYQIISTKFPKAIFTLNSAFYYHQLTDVIPEKYYLATGRGGSKINDERVIQIFENSDALDFGAEMIAYGDALIYMYNKERMLVELLRNKNRLPFDYYKENIPATKDLMFQVHYSYVFTYIILLIFLLIKKNRKRKKLEKSTDSMQHRCFWWR